MSEEVISYSLNISTQWTNVPYTGPYRFPLQHTTGDVAKLMFLVTYVFGEIFSLSSSQLMNTDIVHPSVFSSGTVYS